jgi:Uma2 family endonuclease
VGTAGAIHELIKSRVFVILVKYHLRTMSGQPFSEAVFTLGLSRARIPDVAWVSDERVRRIPWENRATAIAPDVAIEIISGTESPEQMDRKLRDYLEAGVEFWRIFPSTESLTIWREKQGFRLDGDQLVTSEKLRGFSVPISEFFRR